MIALTDFMEHSEVSRGQLMEIVEGLKGYLSKMKSTGYILILFDRQKDYYATIYEEQAQVYIDSRLSIVKEIHINDLSNSLKLKYRNRFNFKFDQDQGSKETHYSAEGLGVNMI